jgi:hypothetical protein
MSYTHVVFLRGGKKILKTPLAEVGIALYQIKDLLTDQEGALILLWVLEFLRMPLSKRNRKKVQVDYFYDYKRRSLFDILRENSLLLGDTGKGFRLEKVFELTLTAVQSQTNLYYNLFQALSKNTELIVEEVSNEDETTNSVVFNTLEMLANGIEISFDYYNEQTGQYSNIDHVPEKDLILFLGGEGNYQYLKGLIW